MITLYEFDGSPYCAKIRKLLDYKKLPYQKVEVNYVSRAEPKALSGQGKVPVIKDGDKVVNDSTAIALYLEERYATPPALPSDPAARGRTMLVEDWADEKLAASASVVKMLMPGNAEKVVKGSLAREGTPGWMRLVAPLGPPVLRAMYRRRRLRGRTLDQAVREFQGDLDRVEQVLAGAPYVMGEAPTLPDFSIYGFLVTMEGLSGFEHMRARPGLSAWYDRMRAL